jgi:hypothetical protein
VAAFVDSTVDTVDTTADGVTGTIGGVIDATEQTLTGVTNTVGGLLRGGLLGGGR